MDDILKQNIIKDLGFEHLPLDKRDEVILAIGKLIFHGVLIRLMDILGDDDKEHLEKMLAEKPGDDEAVLLFLKERVPDLDDIVREEIKLFKKESLEFMNQLN